MMASRMTYSKSGSSAKALKRLSQTPAFNQREKRRKVLFQGPTSSGRPRHGAPVRATHKTASTNRRLSRPVTPRSPALPGTESSIRSRRASDKTMRIKSPSTQKNSLGSHTRPFGNPIYCPPDLVRIDPDAVSRLRTAHALSRADARSHRVWRDGFRNDPCLSLRLQRQCRSGPKRTSALMSRGCLFCAFLGWSYADHRAFQRFQNSAYGDLEKRPRVGRVSNRPIGYLLHLPQKSRTASHIHASSRCTCARTLFRLSNFSVPKTPCPIRSGVTRLTVCMCRGLRRMVRCLASCIGDGSWKRLSHTLV